MTAALRTELAKLLGRPALRGSVLTAAVMAVVFGYVIPYTVRSPDPDGIGGQSGGEEDFSVPVELLFPGNLVENVIGGFPLFYLALALVLGALSTGSEYTWGTIRTVLLHGPGRLTILAAKVVSLVAGLLVVALAAYGAGWATSLVIAAIEDGPLGAPPALDLAKGVGAAWLILAVGGLLGLAGGVVARGAGAVIGAGLVYLFVVELLLRNFATRSEPISAVAELLPGTNAGALAGALAGRFDDAPGVNTLVSVEWALALLGGWCALALAATSTIFARRDVTT